MLVVVVVVVVFVGECQKLEFVEGMCRYPLVLLLFIHPRLDEQARPPVVEAKGTEGMMIAFVDFEMRENVLPQLRRENSSSPTCF